MAAARPRPAAIIPLQDLRPEHAGAKVRVAGCLVAYDAESGYGFLHRLDSTLLVDLTLCSAGSPPLIHKPMIMLIGDLERYTASLPTAMAMEQLAPSESLSDLVLRAALLRSCDGLDFQSWDQAARTESATRWSEAMR
ncbi:unnamed protein product [Jaminaea pallidilutea]